MSTKDNGGPAFPGEVGPAEDGCAFQTGHRQWMQPGMSLRDYMAIHASELDINAQAQVLRLQSPVSILPDNWVVLARYMHADQMLEARK